MKKLQTQYLGLTLKNPLLVSSSGLTNSIEKLVKIQEQGAGAVVLKSLFQEQIIMEAEDALRHNAYPEALDYLNAHTQDHRTGQYTQLIREAKQRLDIPVVASLNCIDDNDWVAYAKEVEEAGADALELNIFIIPAKIHQTAAQIEEQYERIVKKVRQTTKLPLAVKVSYQFTNLLNVLERLKGAGASAAVLFNRFYEPDIDIFKMRTVSSEVFSSGADIRQSLRWMAIASSHFDAKTMQLSASTGVHDGTAFVKQLLAGATTVQVCSALYKQGVEVVRRILNFTEDWMDGKGFSTLDDFRGRMGYGNISNPAIYERTQFMRYFSSVE